MTALQSMAWQQTAVVRNVAAAIVRSNFVIIKM